MGERFSEEVPSSLPDFDQPPQAPNFMPKGNNPDIGAAAPFGYSAEASIPVKESYVPDAGGLRTSLKTREDSTSQEYLEL
jgi:hypothetical protein